jgi:REP element-mobilizing transposase RayT
MRKNPLVTGEYYQIYNRGVDKRDIFMNRKDLSRFIQSVKEFNTIFPVGNLRDRLRDKLYCGHWRRRERGQNPLVSIICYCFNPNHFHLILRQETDGGISEFLKRLLGGYTKYFNQVHNRSGALFQGRFKSHIINNDQYFLKIFPYVNINYLIHDIPQEKSYLTMASDKEYEKMNFDIVSKKEALNLLKFYGNNKLFGDECLSVVSVVREQRGKIPLTEEDFSTDVGRL